VVFALGERADMPKISFAAVEPNLVFAVLGLQRSFPNVHG
jgi:hypothetical protein